MSSSLRNSLHRRNHKERSQLAHRSRLGILEKHKDYVKRAKDFHSKQDRIKRLKEKAADRNKDEFYFGMIRSRTEGGVHVKSRGNTSLPTDMVKVLKSQDGNYIRAVRQTGLKKIDKLKAQLSVLADLMTPGKVGNNEHGGRNEEDSLDVEELDVLRAAGILPPGRSKGNGRRKSTGSKSKHVVFVSNDEEARNYCPPSSRFESDSPKPSRTGHGDNGAAVDLGWEWPEDKPSNKRSKRPAAEGHAEDIQEGLSPDERKEYAAAHRRQLLKELAARLKRDVNLHYAGRELEMQRLLMGKGAARKMRDVEKVEGEEEADEDNEDALDAMKGKRRKIDVGMEEKPYRPRVYKWRAERKK